MTATPIFYIRYGEHDVIGFLHKTFYLFIDFVRPTRFDRHLKTSDKGTKFIAWTADNFRCSQHISEIGTVKNPLGIQNEHTHTHTLLESCIPL